MERAVERVIEKWTDVVGRNVGGGRNRIIQRRRESGRKSDSKRERERLCRRNRRIQNWRESDRKSAKRRDSKTAYERVGARDVYVTHQVRSKVSILEAELGVSILERRRALETVTITTRHSTTALT